VDTGSNYCACTYKVITTLQTRPIWHKIVHAPDVRTKEAKSNTKLALIYAASVRLDNFEKSVPIIRVTGAPEGIDFILGMSVLQEAKITIQNNEMEITFP